MNLNEQRIVVSTIIQDKNPAINIVPEQWDILLHLAQLKHFKRKIGLPEEYVPGAPIPAQVFEITQKISDDLIPFTFHMGRAGTPPLYVSSNGEATTPTDMYYPATMTYNLIKPGGGVEPRMVDIVNDKEWQDLTTSYICNPTKRFPIANFKKDYIRFDPKNLQMVDFTYIKFPTKPVFAYTITNGYVEYDSVNSVELEWDEVNQLDILYILLSDLGVVATKADVFQISEKVKTKGI